METFNIFKCIKSFKCLNSSRMLAEGDKKKSLSGNLLNIVSNLERERERGGIPCKNQANVS